MEPLNTRALYHCSVNDTRTGLRKTFPLPTVLAVVWIHETRELEAVGMAEETGRRHLKCYEANGMTSRAHTVRMQLTAQWKQGGSKISLGSISGSSISTP